MRAVAGVEQRRRTVVTGVAIAMLAAAGCAGQAGQRAPSRSRAGAGAASGKPAAEPATITIPAADPIGWATVADLGQAGTTGGGADPGVRASTVTELATALAGDEPRNVLLMRPVAGAFDVGSNKTLIGAPGAVLKGSLELNGSVNVIVRNLKIVGYNCSDAEECKHGHDAVTISGAAHHVWFDHCDISDGSDGNLDIVEGSDYITISWTVFSYSGRRPGDHQFSSLLGNSDGAGDLDRGHLRITFHHDWWADNVAERMPRVRFGQVHVFNNLYTATGNHYCIGLGAGAAMLVENNAFVGVRTPFQTEKFSDATSVLVERGNLFARTQGNAQGKGTGGGFTPPYPYKLEPADAVRLAVMRGAGIPGARRGLDSDDSDDDDGAASAPAAP
jgi:pectate lyase